MCCSTGCNGDVWPPTEAARTLGLTSVFLACRPPHPLTDGSPIPKASHQACGCGSILPISPNPFGTGKRVSHQHGQVGCPHHQRRNTSGLHKATQLHGSCSHRCQPHGALQGTTDMQLGFAGSDSMAKLPHMHALHMHRSLNTNPVASDANKIRCQSTCSEPSLPD